jgi:hypothetical protein
VLADVLVDDDVMFVVVVGLTLLLEPFSALAAKLCITCRAFDIFWVFEEEPTNCI